jgi:hypothetical protein
MAFQATEEDFQLTEYLLKFYDDPLGFVMAVYPWRKPGTILEEEDGPDDWQAEYLENLGREVRECDQGLREVIQIAVASGHGPGKTAMVAWIIHWYLSTRPDAHVVVTANTGSQLSDKTWREVAKWKTLAINGHHFEWTATSYRFIPRRDKQYAAAIPQSEHNSEAFAGLHEKYVMTIYDEASAIPNIIWEVTTGSLTTRGAIHLAFGNMTRSSGKFYECFHKNRHRWTTFSVDSRTAKKANKKLMDQWIEDYGIDSDYVRVRVLGLPPKQAALQFIPTPVVQEALDREIKEDTYRHASKVMGVDVAREGDDETVITLRQGLKLMWQKAYRGLNLMEVAQLTAELEDKNDPDAVFVDAVGIGAGVVDRGRQLGRRWMEHKGSHRSAKDGFANKRAECWSDMKYWLENADLSTLSKEGRQLVLDDLTGIEYSYDKLDRLILEKKSDMKARGLHSPDRGDSIAMTFTQKVLPRHQYEEDYDYYEAERQRQKADSTRSVITGY